MFNLNIATMKKNIDQALLAYDFDTQRRTIACVHMNFQNAFDDMVGKSSLYTPRCKDFKAAFKGLANITTHATETIHYDGSFTDFDGSVYINHREWVSIGETDGKLMVYINNPGCPVDADGCTVFTKEHPQQQWVFGDYESFKRALNRALAIVRGYIYPKPIEIW